MKDILLNRKLLKNVILQRKKQNKKERDEKKKARLICCAIQSPAGLMANFYLYHLTISSCVSVRMSRY